MSIITTIEADFQKVEAAVESAAVAVGAEAKAIIVSVGSSAYHQALILFKETHIGTMIANSVSAVEASGGNLANAMPTIVANVVAGITALDKGSSVLAGIEAELASFATDLINIIVAGFKANNVVGPLITLASSVL